MQCRTIGNGNLPLHHCQKVSGSAFSVNIVVPASSVTWQGQSPASYADKGESGKPLSRKFCRNCGSSLATEADALPGAIIIKAGTLDYKLWLKPNTQYPRLIPHSHGYELSQVRRHFQGAGFENLALVVAVAADYWLLGLFGPLTLTQTDAWAAAVLVDEFDTVLHPFCWWSKAVQN